ncbi:MAG: hypothetical protein HC904_04360 [Blastochloris sp.]|nr:hypothetical protein [Blastochloris sp.]
MRRVDLGKYRKARIWLNELPDASCPTGVTQEISVSAKGESVMAKRAAVEVFVPLGPRSMYGLLGGEFTPSTTGQLNVTIISSAANGKSLSESLASSSDQVRVGLPREYCEAVKEGIRLAQAELSPASGELVINYAAHGEIGSCAAVFKHLAAVLVRLVNSKSLNLTDDEIASFFRRALLKIQRFNVNPRLPAVACSDERQTLVNRRCAALARCLLMGRGSAASPM